MLSGSHSHRLVFEELNNMNQEPVPITQRYVGKLITNLIRKPEPSQTSLADDFQRMLRTMKPLSVCQLASLLVPRKSIRRMANETVVSKSSIHRILKLPNCHPFKKLYQRLSEDYMNRIAQQNSNTWMMKCFHKKFIPLMKQTFVSGMSTVRTNDTTHQEAHIGWNPSKNKVANV